MALKPTSLTPTINKTTGPCYGIDGWLRLIQIHMLIYFTQLIIAFISDWIYIFNNFDAVVSLINIITVPFQISLIVISFILMVNRLMLFRVFYTILLFTFILTSIITILMGNTGMGVYNIIVCSIWIGYLYKSERVKNTFRKLGQAKTEYEVKLEKKKKVI